MGNSSRYPQKRVVHEVGPKGPPTEIERVTFEELKAEYINIEKTSWKRKAEILLQMKANRLYRCDGYDTFEKFCESVFDLTRQRAHQLICSIRTVEIAESELSSHQTTSKPNVNHGLHSPPKLTERHARELQKLPSNRMREAVAKLKGKEKITQKDVERAVKDTKREVAAAKSSSIAGHVQTAMLTAEEIAKQCRAIKAGCTALDDILQGPFGVHMPTGQPLDAIKRTVALIAAGSPYADCVYCGSKGGNCKSCNGHGWVTKLQFKAVPYELRVKSKVHVQDDAA